MDWPVLYEALNRENLIEDLRADGYDAVVLDFTEATEPIQRNAMVLTELIAQLRDVIPRTARSPWSAPAWAVWSRATACCGWKRSRSTRACACT